MTRFRRPSAQTIAVVLALAEQPAAWRYGYELCRQLGIKPGSMYPILVRLTDRGLLETSWETDVPTGRPPRHLYRLTGSGRAMATELATANANADTNSPAPAPRSGSGSATAAPGAAPKVRWQGA
ncbi:PadR family transcriptional regulator [Streptomyces formicae]|uniref:PadR family transcriptional regulator n=1 Tax=Streptomyces formicae TaxID=1616117 RepID=A0ABY3WTR9_9ACTN|nr:PadR family transcriptional regulator [Streptomyces formicae]UNM16052.1 PadR family transcriptional regulator [Streptomyces formicae]